MERKKCISEKRKYIDTNTRDTEWHQMGVEYPSVTADVELLQHDGTVVNGKIVGEMSGYYVYLDPGWGSMKDYTHWRFRQEK